MCKVDSMKLNGIIGGSAVLLTGFIVNAPPIRSRLKTPIVRVVASGLLAGVITAGGLLIAHFVVNAR
jgi:hypothetical protein